MPYFFGCSYLDLIGYVLLFPIAGSVINGLLGKKLSKPVVGIIGCTAIDRKSVV